MVASLVVVKVMAANPESLSGMKSIPQSWSKGGMLSNIRLLDWFWLFANWMGQ